MTSASGTLCRLVSQGERGAAGAGTSGRLGLFLQVTWVLSKALFSTGFTPVTRGIGGEGGEGAGATQIF